MNPSNPFGSPHGGTLNTGLFQSFAQQSSNSQSQSPGFYQPSAFGQRSSNGNTKFGQSTTQTTSMAQGSQGPSFGQPSLQISSSGFGTDTTRIFGQTNKNSEFELMPAFGKSSTFGQVSEFGKGSGQQHSGFGSSQETSGSTPSGGQPLSLGFGHSVFRLPSPTSAASAFTTAHSATQSRGFSSSNFSFKPVTETLFKPILSAPPEPFNIQMPSMSSSAFGSTESQTGSSIISSSSNDTTDFSLLNRTKSGPLDFSFSQPAAAPSVSANSPQLTTGNASRSSDNLQFTFSQPAVPSSSNTQASISQPNIPSTFSFSVSPSVPQATNFLGGTGFVQPSAFGNTNINTDTNADDRGSDLEDRNVFARLSRGAKRKEDPAFCSTGLEKSATEERVPAEADSSRPPPKRLLTRSCHPSGGIFGRALSDLRRDGSNPVKREATKEAPPQSLIWEEVEKNEVQGQSNAPPVTPPTSQGLTKDLLQKSQKSDIGNTLYPDPEKDTPVKPGVHGECVDNMTCASPADCNAIQCRNVPPALNKKDIIEKHFGQFGKVRKVFCRPAKNLAIVQFDDHASAAKAKKKGKILHRQELLILWQKKKQSAVGKQGRPAGETVKGEEGAEVDLQYMGSSSPVKRSSFRAPLASSMTSSQRSPLKNSPLAKSLLFDIDTQKENYTESQSPDSPVPSSLLHLIGQVAETAEDKYRLLEQRDKILRQGRPKRTDLDMSKVFVGTCPDMCPEKERFMRETRKQLSVFEVIPDTEMVDHTAAIKEYSRSSADQEEPLPHELRPLPVLSMTLDYLITQIMDQGHENYRDWYDFVWNRTRGIRKDITQQHLCCPQTVALIEKCTRFHVHCAHHLCEEHMSSFDAKINNENMTKCLQSLKEMYQDLATHHIYCSQEAEFRQYSVLLKLNDGDILREVQQFRDEVRNSPEVKFAVQVFAAVSSNNFVRFFKLVKGASYLASCLLHRYFNQVRSKALKALNLAHTVGPRSTPFPLEDIVRMLMFDSAAEATVFIQQYGLIVNDDVVELSRITYQPDPPLSQKKSKVILSKTTILIGEVVNGGPLPPISHHIPACSFDSHNKYIGEGPPAEPSPSQFIATAPKLEARVTPTSELLTHFVPVTVPDAPSPLSFPEDFAGKNREPRNPYYSLDQPASGQQLFQPVSQPQPVKRPSPPPNLQPVYCDEDVTEALEYVIEEVVEAAVREVAHAGFSYATAATVESSVQAESVVNEVLGQMMQEISSTEIDEERQRIAEEEQKQEEARRRQEYEAFLVNLSFSLCTEIVHEVLDETIKETANLMMQQAVDEKMEFVVNCTEQICASIVEETLSADINLLVEDFLEAQLQHIYKYINRWRDVVAVRRQLKRQMREFPAAPCCVDPQFKLKALAPTFPTHGVANLDPGGVNQGNLDTLAISSTRLLKLRQEVIHQMRVHYYYHQLLDEAMWVPLNLPALVTENISNPSDRIFWKAVLLLPSNDDGVSSLVDRILSDWLESKFGGGKGSDSSEEQLDGALKTLCVTNTVLQKGQQIHRVHISIKASRGPLTEHNMLKVEECCELDGAGALIMLLPSMPIFEAEHNEVDVSLLSALLQLKQLQKASTWHCPLPLVILVPGSENGNTQKLEEALMLHTLVEEDLILEYNFFFIPENTCDLQGCEQLKQVMSWLLVRAPQAIQLSCQPLLQLVEATLSHEFTSRVYTHHQDRAAAHLPSYDPMPVIQLYNAVLAHIADKVSSQELGRLSWPPCEFWQPDTRDFVPHHGWNSVQHLAWLRKTILSLQLPPWEQLSTTESWSELCYSIFHYAAQTPVSNRNQPLLISRLENLLERVRLKECCNRISRSKQTMRPAFSQIPWDDVLLVCVDHKLRDWQIPEPPECEDAVTADGEILVYFNADSLNSFQPPEEWTEAVKQTQRAKQGEREKMGSAFCGAQTRLSFRQRLFPRLVDFDKTQTASQDSTHTPTEQAMLANRVLHCLEEEISESKRITEQLKHWQDGDPEEYLSTPLFVPSSTLSMQTAMRLSPAAKTRVAAVTQAPEPTDPSNTANWNKATPVSLKWRMRELQRQISSSREEELACRVKLSGLLTIVED